MLVLDHRGLVPLGRAGGATKLGGVRQPPLTSGCSMPHRSSPHTLGLRGPAVHSHASLRPAMRTGPLPPPSIPFIQRAVWSSPPLPTSSRPPHHAIRLRRGPHHHNHHHHRRRSKATVLAAVVVESEAVAAADTEPVKVEGSSEGPAEDSHLPRLDVPTPPQEERRKGLHQRRASSSAAVKRGSMALLPGAEEIMLTQREKERLAVRRQNDRLMRRREKRMVAESEEKEIRRAEIYAINAFMREVYHYHFARFDAEKRMLEQEDEEGGGGRKQVMVMTVEIGEAVDSLTPEEEGGSTEQPLPSSPASVGGKHSPRE